jgi:hypothetical protein
MENPLPIGTANPVTSFCCYQLDPTHDRRWSDFVDRHPRSSVFHTPGWLKALRRTYGYEPVVFTTSPPTGPLKNGLVFCRVKSWLTGNRLVSLPFSDHCEPLCDSAEDLAFLVRYLKSCLEPQNCKYLEVRPVNGNFARSDEQRSFTKSSTYYLHRLNLRSDLKDLFRHLDKDCVRRRIQRADRAGLVEKCGSSDELLLRDFYALFVATRGRHRLPPIPLAWFRNLVLCQGQALEIRLAYEERTPVSGILTLRFKDVVYFKYGCSDVNFNNLGATPWLLWRAIAAAKSSGAIEFDMGRTEVDNPGLLAFKNHWVPQPTQLVYLRFPEAKPLDAPGAWKIRFAKRVFSCMPKNLLRLMGRLIYRHIG